MSSEKYIKDSLVTEARTFDPVKERFSAPDNRLLRLNHAALGLASETSELSEAIKKQDLVNVNEEVGDQTWYMAIAIDALGLDKNMIATPEELPKAEKSIKRMYYFLRLLTELLSLVVISRALDDVQRLLAPHMQEGAVILGQIVFAISSYSILMKMIREAIKMSLSSIFAGRAANAASEFCDLVKKEMMYGKKVELSSYEKTLKALVASLSCVAESTGNSLESAMKVNTAKLMKRYSGGFTEQKAVERDLSAEREILEGKSDATKK